MKISTILSEIEADVQDVLATNFVYSSTKEVPNRDDSGLSYERGKDKRGKEIETCVLFVDIRNSVALTDKHQHQTMGRVYTAFTKAVLKAARHHGGHTRNIIGDRVMVVFPVDNCFKNAVDCAVSINHIAFKIINQRFKVDFNCGIGIAYGKLRVIKVGIQRNGTENGENKGLVWVGKPANYASRITDMANKTIEEEMVEVTLNPINPLQIKSPFGDLSAFTYPFDLEKNYTDNQPYYLSKVEKRTYTKEQFVNQLANFEKGEIGFLDGNLLSFKTVTKLTVFPSILVTKKVFEGLKKEDPNRNCLVKNFLSPINHKFKNMDEEVFGSSLIWII